MTRDKHPLVDILMRNDPLRVTEEDRAEISRAHDNLKTLNEARIIARSSDPEWVGDELFRLQELAHRRGQFDSAALQFALYCVQRERERLAQTSIIDPMADRAMTELERLISTG